MAFFVRSLITIDLHVLRPGSTHFAGRDIIVTRFCYLKYIMIYKYLDALSIYGVFVKNQKKT